MRGRAPREVPRPRELRDLGTALQGLQVLWIARSGLVELEGLGAFVNLRELYAAFNDVTDVSPLAELDELQRKAAAGPTPVAKAAHAPPIDRPWASVRSTGARRTCARECGAEP